MNIYTFRKSLDNRQLSDNAPDFENTVASWDLAKSFHDSHTYVSQHSPNHLLWKKMISN